MKLGIIGGGFVGGAVARGWMEHAEVRIFDVLPEKRTHTRAEVFESDVIFVCLPTPMGETGAADLSYLYDFFATVKGGDKRRRFVLNALQTARPQSLSAYTLRPPLQGDVLDGCAHRSGRSSGRSVVLPN